MNKLTRAISLFIASSIILASCSSTTMIVSNPPNAKLYIDGELVGETPYNHCDSKIVGNILNIKIEKEGYKPLITSITKNEEADIGAIIGGLFLFFPYLWTLKYSPIHTYGLLPITADGAIKLEESQQIQNNIKSKAFRLRELKKLLDDKIITQDDFEKEKVKVLNEKE